jgi:hypothetical protein
MYDQSLGQDIKTRKPAEAIPSRFQFTEELLAVLQRSDTRQGFPFKEF